VLRQRFDVEKELEAARLLNAQQETHVDRCAICNRRRQRYRSRDIDELKSTPLGCDGGCSSVVPLTVTLLVPLPHGGRSTVTTTDVEVRGRKSAMPLGAGNVVRIDYAKSQARYVASGVIHDRSANVQRSESGVVGGSEVKSRTRFGGDAAATQISSRFTANEAFRSIGELRFSGPGAPRR
jgi:hypothetical protein